ncbi:MAG: glycosyltransferase [Chloroflexi bacterium]|nr:glycosyltransferase [Chloroflexota bacterium]
MAKRSDAAPAPRVTVVIPTRNAGPRFERALQAVAAQQLDEPFEALAIDSGSTDGTPERCEAHGWRVLRIPPRCFGHGRTRNQAIAAARGELVALTVQDAVPGDPHWLSALVAALDAAPHVAGAYSRHRAHPGAGLIARFVAEYWYRHQDGRVEQRLDDPAAYERLSLEERQMLCTFNDVSSMVRRSVWESIPFRDVAFAEDLAWGYDVLRAGHSVIYEPASQVYHSHERPLSYEFRRSYVEARAVGEILDAPAEMLSFPQAVGLLSLWRTITARADAYRGGSAPTGQADWVRLVAEMQPPTRDRGWFAQRFGLPALANLLGPGSPYPRREQADILFLLGRAANRAGSVPVGRPLVERLKDAVNWLDDWQVAEGLTQRYPGPEQPLVTAADVRLMFDTLWDEIGRDYVRRAVLELPQVQGEAAAILSAHTRAFQDARYPQLEERLHAFVAGLLRFAVDEAALDPALYRDVWRYAGAVVLGKRLGAANRYGLGGRWGAVLQTCLARGI